LVQAIVTCMRNLGCPVLTLARFIDICAIRQEDASLALDSNLYASILCTLLFIGYGPQEMKDLGSSLVFEGIIDIETCKNVKKKSALASPFIMDVIAKMDDVSFLKRRVVLLNVSQGTY